ncbi:PilZ domain-containing protein [Pontixanthobacter aestiaquae]|uniref:PilZ domain-containing protein n=1 Tax=Pontixanthobacter aestiaquae TaxID=1509367 RepID=A0A844Z7I1_9SPHN|nr:PilZ domain-containing protein [Pontixanthobacter aestiaquae]MDN3646248.1 PilZ domain-containing protein [Pontixanthobacter aestiaquae]MXO82760.1 hypothetical protein [Pontixanthobacter aestiaquae]
MTASNTQGQAASPRRNTSRLLTCLPGKLTTMYGSEDILLFDLSLTGAKIGLNEKRKVEETLRIGLDAVLTWEGHETFGQLMWTAKDSVGIQFEESIGTKALMATRAQHDAMVANGGLETYSEHLSQDAAKGWVNGGLRI